VHELAHVRGARRGEELLADLQCALPGANARDECVGLCGRRVAERRDDAGDGHGGCHCCGSSWRGRKRVTREPEDAAHAGDSRPGPAVCILRACRIMRPETLRPIGRLVDAWRIALPLAATGASPVVLPRAKAAI